MNSNFTRLRSGILSLLAIFIVSASVHAQTHTPRTVNVSANCHGLWEYLPANYNSNSNKYPLILYIHGGASYGNGSTSALQLLLSNEGIPYYINQNQFPATFPLNGGTTSFIVISPQFTTGPSPTEIKTVLDYIVQTYRVDLMRVYLTGYSVGGDVTWKAPYNATAANRFAAMVPVAGYNNPYFDTTARFIAGANLPVWAIHSNADGTIPLSASQNMVNKINSFNPLIPAIISIPNGVSHDNTVRVGYDPTYRPNGKNIYEWFLQYAKNYPPVANAGTDISITMPVTSTGLNGSGSSDPENGPLVFAWSKVSGPSQYNISNTAAVSPTVSNLVAGIYKFRLVVTDNGGFPASDTVQVTVINPNPNQLPVAVAGNDQSISLPQTSVSLSGSTSSDADGIIETYNWNKITGPAQYTIANPNSANTAITNLKAGVYTFKLTVTDNEGGQGFDTVQVTIINPFPNVLPLANAGPDQSINLPNSVTLNGNASTDPDGNIMAYLWRQISGPTTSTITNASSPSTTAGNLAAGNYQYELKVTDDSNAVAKDTVLIIVNATATGKQIPAKVEAESYNAMNGVQTETTSDVGGGLNVGWIDNGDWMDYNVNATVSGSYTVGFRVSTPYAGMQLQLRRSNGTVITTVTLPLTGGWQTWNTITTTVNLSAGNQTLRIYSATSGWNLNWIDFAANAGNQPPTANAGTAQSITLPVSSVTLNGSGSDPDGSIASYSWTQVSGTPATIASPSSASTNITGLTPAGVRVFRLSVMDNSGATAFAEVTVTVNSNITAPVITTNSPQTTMSTSASFTSTATAPFPIVTTSWTKFLVPGQTMKRVTIVGSSTSAGYAASINDSGYASKLRTYYKAQGIIDTIYNLAISGTSVFDVNITAALDKGAPILLVNYPSNAFNGTGFTVPQICAKFQEIADSCAGRGVQFYTTGTQPRNDFGPVDRVKLNEINDSLRLRFGPRFIDFMTAVLNTTDNSIIAEYSAGDGIHENDLGHERFFQLVRAANIFQNTISSSSTIATPTAANTTVNNLGVGVHKFQVSIIDNRGLAASAVAQVTVNNPGPPNTPPVARAGNDQTITLPATSVTLNGTGSTDDHNIIAYQWTKLTGTGGTITTSNGPTTTFTGLSVGTYTVELKVTDDSSAIGRDTIQINVNNAPNSPPVARAGNDQTIVAPASSVTLNGSSSTDDHNILTYQWTKLTGTGGTVTTPGGITTTFTGLSVGTYTVELKVTDDSSAVGRDTVQITVTNATGKQVPGKVEAENYDAMSGIQTENTADAGGGLNVSYFDNGDWLNYNLTVLSAGTYTLAFRVATVNSGGVLQLRNTGGTVLASASIPNTGGWQTWTTVNTSVTLSAGVQTLRVYCAASSLNFNWMDFSSGGGGPVNQLPTANAGSPQIITLPTSTASLTGSGTDPDGTINSYAWTQVGGTAATIASPGTAATNITGLTTVGVRTFRLTVTDNQGGIGTADVTVTVNPSPAGKAIPGRIEAESYDASLGVSTENTADVGGGLNVGWIDNGDWMNYNVNVAAAGTYIASFRVASPNTGTQLQVRSGSTILLTVNIPNTGGWQNWTTVTGNVTLAAGSQTLRVYANTTGWNFNWVDFASGAGARSSIVASPGEITEPVYEGPSVLIFPNPAKDQFIIQVNDSHSGNVKAQIIDEKGSLKKEIQFNKNEGIGQVVIQTNDLPTGIYFVRVQTGAFTKTVKLIKL